MSSAGSSGAGVTGAATAVSTAPKHPLHRQWTIWELRKKDPRQGLGDWKDLPLPLYKFNTVEDFWQLWRRTPKITELFDNGIGEPAKVERSTGQRVTTTVAEAYMLFVSGVEPLTEYEVSPGVRATKARRRAELAVRPAEFDSWQRAWEVAVLAFISESIDPAEYLVGAYLQDKHSRGTVALRLELWFSTDDERICDAIAEELRLLLKAELPELPFKFSPVVRRAKEAGGGRR